MIFNVAKFEGGKLRVVLAVIKGAWNLGNSKEIVQTHIVWLASLIV